MGFLLVVLSFVVAEEVVELEPVKASSTNHYGCNALTTQGICNADPYCYWMAAQVGKAAKCIDDPCLRYATADETCPPNAGIIDDRETINCGKITLTNYANHDCSGNSGSGNLCAQTAVDKTNLYTYCEYTQLKDDSCPDSICMKINNGAKVEKHCVQNNVVASTSYPCSFLTETDCKLVPKCYWTSGACTHDPCFQAKPITGSCGGLTGNLNWGTNIFDEETCVDWHPYAYQDGSVLDYCIHKDNAKANVCYFGIKNVTTNGPPPRDYGSDWSVDWTDPSDPGTYPTYNYANADPVCAGSLSRCEGHGECKTIINQKGALAGQYCTDGKHAAANILRIPSLLIFLIFLSAMFSL